MTPTSTAFDGPERRHGERNRLIIFWSVIFICIVVSSGALLAAKRSNDNANRSEKAHCVLIKFLVGSNIRNQATLDADPNGSGSDQRRDAVKQTAALITELRATHIHCAPVKGEKKVRK